MPLLQIYHIYKGRVLFQYYVNIIVLIVLFIDMNSGEYAILLYANR